MKTGIKALALFVGVWCIFALFLAALIFSVASVDGYLYDDTVTPEHMVSAWLDGSVDNGSGYVFIPVTEGGIGWNHEFYERVGTVIYAEWPMSPQDRDNEVVKWLSRQYAYPTLEIQNWFAGRVRDNTKWYIGPIVADPEYPWLHRASATYMDTYEAPHHVRIYGVTVRMHWALTIDERTYVVTAEPDLSRSTMQRFAYSNHHLGFVPVQSR